jgi:hypothetical protein
MATERDFELLDDYLSNRMDAAQKSAFEQRLQADPDLKNEYSLQQNIVTGVRKARAIELKSMLQNVPVTVPTKGGVSTGAKFGIGAFIAAAVVTGIYFYFDGSENQSTSQAETHENKSDQKDVAKSDEAKKQPTPVVQDEQPVEEQKTENKTIDKKQEKVEPAQQPVIDVFDPSEEQEENAVTADEAPRTSENRGGSGMAAEVIKNNRNYSFHYQFNDEKLFLYGPFEKNLYEIMEFFGNDKRTIFLYYKDGYYLLEDKDNKIKPLVPITDAALITKLKESRGN